MPTSIWSFLFQNQNLAQKVAKNTFWLFSGQTFGRLIRAALIIYAARQLGPSSWGAFAYAMSSITLLTTVSDLGINAIVIRETARNPNEEDHFFTTALFLKIILIGVGAAFLIFGGPYITKIPEARLLLPFLTLVFIFDSLRNFNFAISRSKEKMEWEGLDEILTNVVIAGVGFFLLYISPTSANLSLAYLIGTAVGFLAISYKFKNHFQNLRNSFSPSLLKPIFQMAWPFALAGSLGIVMINTDTIMLGWLGSVEEVGWYSASQRIIQFFYVLPALFASSLFPTFSRLAFNKKEAVKRVLETALGIMLLVAIPVSLIGFALGDQIINLLFGSAYQNAAQSFQILILTLIIIFPSIIISNAILAHNSQKYFILFSALGAGGNVLFNFLLIPKLGIAGCALATLLTQIIANAYLWKKMNGIVEFSALERTPRILLGGTLTLILSLLLKSGNLSLVPNLLISSLFYLGVLVILKEPILKSLNPRNRIPRLNKSPELQ